MSYDRSDTIDAIARTVWCLAWADAIEEAATLNRETQADGEPLPNLSGCKLEDVAPPTPDPVRVEAEEALLAFEAASPGEGDKAEVLAETLGLDSDDVGHKLAGHFLGHGFGFYDDHNGYPYKGALADFYTDDMAANDAAQRLIFGDD